jgi:hypothetical protein
VNDESQTKFDQVEPISGPNMLPAGGDNSVKLLVKIAQDENWIMASGKPLVLKQIW